MAPLRLQRPGGPARDPGPPPPGALLRLLRLLRSRDLPAPVEDDFLFSLSGPACWWHLLLGRDLWGRLGLLQRMCTGGYSNSYITRGRPAGIFFLPQL